jgi:hypothetical protein
VRRGARRTCAPGPPPAVSDRPISKRRRAPSSSDSQSSGCRVQTVPVLRWSSTAANRTEPCDPMPFDGLGGLDSFWNSAVLLESNGPRPSRDRLFSFAAALRTGVVSPESVFQGKDLQHGSTTAGWSATDASTRQKSDFMVVQDSEGMFMTGVEPVTANERGRCR